MNPAAVSELARTILAQRYDNYQPTPDFHEELWELCCMDHNKVAVAAPRGHAKTTAVTGSYLISMLVFREAKYAIVISDTESQAAQFIDEIKREFIDNEDLIEVFDVKGLLKDSQTDIIISFKDGYECRVTGKGAEQRLRGRKWHGQRPDLVLVDDLENEELTESENRREKLKRWFYGSVLPAGSDKCLYRVVGTILHFDSLLESLMPQPRSRNGKRNPNFVTEDLKEYDLSGDWMAVKYRAHNEDYSQILWPEKFPIERLKAIKADYSRQGMPDVYAQEYLNEPISEDNAFFERRDFLPLEDSQKEGRLSFYASADLAISVADKAAFTVITVCAMGADGKIQVRDIRRGRWDAQRIMEECFAIQERYEPDIFWMEKENIQRTLGPIFNHEMSARNLWINIEGVTPTKDKQARARPLQARMRAGAMLFDKEQDWYPDLEQEMRRFPKGPYADQVDALSLMCYGIDKMMEPMTSDEIEEEEWEQEFGGYYVGRSAVTGY